MAWLLLAGLCAPAAASEAPRLDPALPSYRPVEGLAGTLTAVGSDTMLVLQALVAEEFRRFHPQVTVEIEGKGSSTAPPALLESTAQIGNMSRRITGGEADAFLERFGYQPVRFEVALDTVGVFVHQDNPLESLTVAQVDALFSRTLRCGGDTDLTVWGQLGLGGDWATAPISLYGRNAASGTYGYFRDHALCRGDYKDTVKEQPGSASVVQGVEGDRYGIGYSGIGYATAGVRAVPIARREGEDPVEASWENAANGRYVFARFLEIYVNKAPDRSLDPLVREFLRFLLSADGQRVVMRAGFHPLDAGTVERQLAKLAG
ncbi:MAG TPA: PstS family phosphate ABC transporter substrate-binding protein [Methylomirabilota bacterium]|nr:PstS family phosphate ABC transporter substrate-binding protein [Methylomirabilota bacterium]